MGENFHTPWVEDVSNFSATTLNDVLSTLDKALTYLKNLIIHCDGDISYSILTGKLTWDDTIRIIFTNPSGDSIQNMIVASNITLSDNEFCYVDLNEIDNSVLTVQSAAIVTDDESNTIAYNRLVLGYRNSASDRFFSRYLDTNPDKLTQAPASGDTVSIDWSLGSFAIVTLDRAITTFSFGGARNGQRVILCLLQDGSGNRDISFGAEVRDGADITLPLGLSTDPDLTDYATFIYRDSLSKYDVIAFVTGY